MSLTHPSVVWTDEKTFLVYFRSLGADDVGVFLRGIGLKLDLMQGTNVVCTVVRGRQNTGYFWHRLGGELAELKWNLNLEGT